MRMRKGAVIESPYFFREYGIVSPIQYVYKGEAFVTLSAHGKPVDFIKESEHRTYRKNPEQGMAFIGQHSQKICIMPDYIDATYLRQKIPKDIMIVFCGSRNNIVWCFEYCKKHYDEICIATPNFYEYVEVAELCDVPVMIPPMEGYWCEKSMRQEVL